MGKSAPSVFYLVLPNPLGLDTPRGSLHLADELYVCERNRAGCQWGKGAMLSNGEQAEILKDWLGWWNLTPNDLSVFMDDAIFARNGSPNGSVSGDFRQSGVRMTPVEKNDVSLESGLGASRSCGSCGHVRDYEGRRYPHLLPIELAAGVTFALTAL